MFIFKQVDSIFSVLGSLNGLHIDCKKHMSRITVSAFCLVSRGSYIHIEVCVSYICLLSLSSIIYLPVRGEDGGDTHVFP